MRSSQRSKQSAQSSALSTKTRTRMMDPRVAVDQPLLTRFQLSLLANPSRHPRPGGARPLRQGRFCRIELPLTDPAVSAVQQVPPLTTSALLHPFAGTAHLHYGGSVHRHGAVFRPQGTRSGDIASAAGAAERAAGILAAGEMAETSHPHLGRLEVTNATPGLARGPPYTRAGSATTVPNERTRPERGV